MTYFCYDREKYSTCLVYQSVGIQNISRARPISVGWFILKLAGLQEKTSYSTTKVSSRIE
jgi:hypothetical protein